MRFSVFPLFNSIFRFRPFSLFWLFTGLGRNVYFTYYIIRRADASVFDKSIEALKKLNAVSYGFDKKLVLNLVYNPVGAFLPPAQEAIEKDFKRELKTRYDVVFNNLFTITNMPIRDTLNSDDARKMKNHI